MKKKTGILDLVSENKFIQILLSIILGFAVGAGFLAIMGLSVGAAYGRLLNSVTTLKGFSYVIVYSVPYIVAGLSVAFSFKTGVFNIGAEGQFVVGSMAACVLSILAPDIPKPILIPLCFLVAALAGAEHDHVQLDRLLPFQLYRGHPCHPQLRYRGSDEEHFRQRQHAVLKGLHQGQRPGSHRKLGDPGGHRADGDHLVHH